MTKPTVGIIGLGAMGAGIAKTLRNNGFTIHVCDERPGVADGLRTWTVLTTVLTTVLGLAGFALTALLWVLVA